MGGRMRVRKDFMLPIINLMPYRVIMSIDNRLDALSNNRACARKDEDTMTDHMH